MSMVTTTTLKTYLPEITGDAANVALGDLLNRVECAVARWLGWPAPSTTADAQLDAVSYTFFLDGPTYSRHDVIRLPVRPVNSITSIHSDVNRQYGSDTLIDSTTYDLDKLNGLVILDPVNATDYFDNGYRAIKVVCNAGYQSSYLPVDIEHAVCVWASQLHRNKATQGKDSITQRAATVSISPKKMPVEVKEILTRYRSPQNYL